MKIIISPAKKMNRDTDSLEVRTLPVFLDKTEILMKWMNWQGMRLILIQGRLRRSKIREAVFSRQDYIR